MNVIEVPPQTSPAQIEFEEQRVERQQTLLDNVRDAATDLDVAVRTRAIVGRDAGETLLSVVEQEYANHILLGWAGSRRRRDVIFGSTIDPLLERASCDVTLVKDPSESPNDIVTLAGGGPHAPVSARRAGEIRRAFPESTLTLLNVQPTADAGSGADADSGSDADESDDSGDDIEDHLAEKADPKQAGRETIESVAADAELSEDEFESRVLVGDDVQETLLEATAEYETVCIGATGTSTVAQALYGSLPQRIVRQSDGTFLMARGENRSPRTFRQALIQRLESE